MKWKALTAAAVLCALGAGMTAAGPVLAQSVTYAPTPSENLTQLQERVGELERMLQQATGDNERLSIELRRARNDNTRLERLLNDAVSQSQATTETNTSEQPAVARSTPAPPPNAGGALGTLPANAAPGAQTLQDAMKLLQLGRFPEAEAAFSAFVQANPQSPDAPEARYFVGRTQVAQRKFADGADTFVKLLHDHPGIPRAPDAWVMLGVSLKGMGKTPEACGVFRDLVTKYPRASASARTMATNEARTAQCAAR